MKIWPIIIPCINLDNTLGFKVYMVTEEQIADIKIPTEGSTYVNADDLVRMIRLWHQNRWISEGKS